ncbi:MAG: PilZ domain-containing protein [Desulfocapsaceae bacterium]
MRYQRLHIRVPASGEVILSVRGEVRLTAKIIDVSIGGLRITADSRLIEQQEYQIQIITPAHGNIEFTGIPVYQKGESIGIRIASIDQDHLKTIYQMVESFQITEEFIKYIDESTIINDWLVDESGAHVSITFETEH